MDGSLLRLGSRFLVLLSTLALTPACVDRQAGCTKENCARMVGSCRVELYGGPSAACAMVEQPPAGFDFDSYCVDTCRHEQAGLLVACLASAADRCEAEGDGSTHPAIVDECAQTGGWPPSRPSPIPPDTACLASCGDARRTCDLACVGGQACADCRRLGTSCEGCLPGGFEVCTDCSARCGQAVFECEARCGGA